LPGRKAGDLNVMTHYGRITVGPEPAGGGGWRVPIIPLSFYNLLVNPLIGLQT
jgi:hypothetical protein